MTGICTCHRTESPTMLRFVFNRATAILLLLAAWALLLSGC